MLVIIGSKNPAKVKAVENAFAHFFKALKVKGIGTQSGVKAQPLALAETAQGAVNRAKNAWHDG